MRSAILVWLMAAALAHSDASIPAALSGRAVPWEEFLQRVTVQRELWHRNTARADVPDAFVDRLRRVADGLRFLIVAEDWCADSVNSVPYVVRLASRAGVPVAILDRTIGKPLMDRHRTPDGRSVTPVVVLIRGGVDVGAWVERPAPLQRLFRSMGDHPEAAAQFAARQSWYDADRGRTTLEEVVAAAERTARVRPR
jgi:hypothetical protein